MINRMDLQETGDCRVNQFGPTVEQAKRTSGERWNALPAVIRATFDCTRKVSISQSLTALGVEAPPARAIERVYETGTGSLVLTVWHDQIVREADGTLTYLINALEWQAEARGVQLERVARMKALLAENAEREAYVLLLKRGWDAKDMPKVERNAPDFVMWRLEGCGHGRFVLRRPMLRKAA